MKGEETLKNDEKKVINIYTDGACSGNQFDTNVGGWGAILEFDGHKKELYGGERNTTNNRMELFAVIMGLRNLKEKCIVKIYTDSAYVADAFNNGWIEQWVSNKWLTAGKKEVKNQDMWKALISETKKHETKFIKVKGHSDNEYNNKCDILAKKQILLNKAD